MPNLELTYFDIHGGRAEPASGTLRDRVVIVEGERREKREINEAYEIRIRSTTTVR